MKGKGSNEQQIGEKNQESDYSYLLKRISELESMLYALTNHLELIIEPVYQQHRVVKKNISIFNTLGTQRKKWYEFWK